MNHDPIDQPHDRLTKGAFGRKAGARALLATFLPRELRAELDLDRLEIVAGDLLSDDLRESFADLVFSLPVRPAIEGSAGSEEFDHDSQSCDEDVVLVHVLFEHKSTSHRFTVVDLFVSTGRLWSMWRRAHPRANRLPRILPILLHHGRSAWSAPSTIGELLQDGGSVNSELVRFEPQLPVLVIDLATASESQLDAVAHEDALAGASLFLLQHSRDDDAEESILRRVDLLVNVLTAPEGNSGFALVLHYVIAVTCRGMQASLFFARILDRMPRSVRDMEKSLLEQWVEKGMEQGVEKGIEKGIELGLHRGEATGKRTLLRVLIETRFPEFVGDFDSYLSTVTDPKEFDRLARLVVCAKSLLDLRRSLET